MDVSAENDYQPPKEFVEDKKDLLVDLKITDSTELWLIQWPINQSPDFDGKEVSLKLNGDGHLGSSECSSAGKISRWVSLIHYPELDELKKRNTLKSSQSQRSSTATSTLSGRPLATPTRSIKPKNPHTMSGQVTTTPSSRTKSTTTQDSGKGNRFVTSTGSIEHSEERKSKKKRKIES
ncbi:uncharacterized protein [Primulina huaijiensis]|uniref:uncharacterized protein isoform X2 n=1 Tax=Primulina huaijiensis TaxID=1492673 RepID=UPI003CC73A40